MKNIYKLLIISILITCNTPVFSQTKKIEVIESNGFKFITPSLELLFHVVEATHEEIRTEMKHIGFIDLSDNDSIVDLHQGGIDTPLKIQSIRKSPTYTSIVFINFRDTLSLMSEVESELKPYYTGTTGNETKYLITRENRKHQIKFTRLIVNGYLMEDLYVEIVR